MARHAPALSLSRSLALLDLALPAALGLAVAGLILAVQSAGLEAGPLRTLIIFGLPLVLCFSFSRRPVRFGLGIAALFLASLLHTSEMGSVLHAERSFYGIHRVVLHPNGGFHMLAHGGTLHGMQSLEPERRDEPLSYFYPTGPIGQVFAAFSGPDARQRVAVVGLGAGSLACYREPGQQWTFYELDPIVVQIARDPRYFTFLQDCTPDAPMVLGDARLQLAQTADQYDLLILDAYSSDAPPLHLLTREALALYLERLSPDGILAFNISNDFLNLKPVLGTLAADAGLVALGQDDLRLTHEEAQRGKRASQWAIMARERAHLGRLATDPRWQPLAAPAGAAVWTDDYSSILTVLK